MVTANAGTYLAHCIVLAPSTNTENPSKLSINMLHSTNCASMKLWAAPLSTNIETHCTSDTQCQVFGNPLQRSKDSPDRCKRCTSHSWWWRWRMIFSLYCTVASCLYLLILILFSVTVGEKLDIVCLPRGTTMSRCPWLLACEA